MKLKRHIPKRIRENFNLEDEDFDQMTRIQEEDNLRKLLRDEIVEMLSEDSLIEEESYDDEAVKNAEKISKIELDTAKKKSAIEKQNNR